MTDFDHWHISDDELQRYVDGSASPWVQASIESHLLGCAQCRDTTAATPSGPRLGKGPIESTDPDRLWSGIADRIDECRRPMRSSTRALQVSLSSPPLLLVTTALSGLLLTVVIVMNLVDASSSVPMLLTLAPVAPAGGAVLAFRLSIDPAGQMAGATPLAGGQLPFLRALVASSVSLVAGVIATAFVSIGWSGLALWLLPAVALTATVLATATWMDPALPAASLSATWAVLVLWWTPTPRGVPVRAMVSTFIANAPPLSWGCIAAAAVGTAICVYRRDSLPTWRTI